MVTATSRMLTITREIHAPVAQVWQSLTNRDDLCDWLCDDAQMNAVQNSYYLWVWNATQRYAYGSLIEVDEHHKLVFSFQDGDAATGNTRIEIYLTAHSDEQVALTLTQSGFTSDEQAYFYQGEWERWLDNLKSILETGANRNITDRVLLGVYVAEFNAEIARQHNVPVSAGVRLASVLPGLSAEAAGLQANDVIVEVSGTPVSEVGAIGVLNRGKKPGEVVPVVYYRGSEKQQVELELRGYPLPHIPATFAEHADTTAALFQTLDAELSAALDGLDEQTAARKPAAAEWNIREILAHLILSQRHQLEWLSTYANGPRRSNPFTEEQARINAVLAAHPTLSELHAELRRTWAETVAMLREFTPQHDARKNYRWWIAFEMQYNPENFRRRLREIAALRAGVPA